jgi:hypothetical protein
MSNKRRQVNKIKKAFEIAKRATRDSEGYFEDLDLHGDVGCALGEIGKEKLYEFKDEVFSYLTDPFAEFREEAIKTLGWDTRLHVPDFQDKAHEIWLNDPDEDVKRAALNAWACYYIDTANVEVMKELYNIFISRDNPIELRTHALAALIDVAEAPADRREGYHILSLGDLEEHSELEEAIDWDRVRTLMKKYVPGWEEVHPS